jgi:nucleoside-diphosphate-sugar epimerase
MDYAGTFDGNDVLITGGAGAIGNNLVKQLLNTGVVNIYILDDFSSGYRWLLPEDDRITVIEGSVIDDEKLKRAFKHEPEYIYHLAAHFANQNSVDHPETDLRINGLGTLKVLQYADLINPIRVVYASSGCGVYGHDSELPFEETDISIHLDTPYQVTKLLGELYANYYYTMYDLPISSARFFNSFGPGEVPGEYRNVIPNFFYWAHEGRSLPITGDGSETRDWTYVGDIVDGLMRMAGVDEARGEAFNLATGSEHEVREMTEMIINRVDSNVGIEYTEHRSWDNKSRIVGSIEKAERILGYEPSVSLEKGIDAVGQWFDENYERIDECAGF